MKVIIPMAGTGDRFVKKGYVDPKPLIKVNQDRIIKYIYDMFDKNDEIIFICNEGHIKNTNMKFILEEMVPGCKIFTIPNHKKGPVFTLLSLNINEIINDDEEVIICYCDNPYLWNYSHFKNWVKENDSDGCILSHIGFHPHRLSPTFMAHIKENNLLVSEIKEKEPYTNDPVNEHASTGTYYFKKGSYIKKYFKSLMDLNINYNGEFYVTLVYNLLIKDSLKVHCYPTDFVTVFGTPEEVENFEAWQTLLNSTQVKSEEDLIKTYRYWKAYNEARSSQ
jgi:NDP-sugar pyrophosphorylase family protein